MRISGGVGFAVGTVTFLRQPGWLLQNFVLAKKRSSGEISMEGNLASGPTAKPVADGEHPQRLFTDLLHSRLQEVRHVDVSHTIDRIYADFGPALVSQARRILKNSDDAYDCVHDVLFRLWQRPHLFSPEKGTLRSFLFACVGNEARSRQRLEGRRQRILRASAAEFTAPGRDFESHVDRLQLSYAIAALPPLQRQAITLHYLHDMRHSDIAEQLDTPIGTIKTRIHQAKRRLRCWLS